MRRGCRIGDYVVTVGAVALVNERLEDDHLVVRLLNVDSYDRRDDRHSCRDHLYSVRVSYSISQSITNYFRVSGPSNTNHFGNHCR